ncbi:hypothetical protein CRG98_033247 [Punica granatum]|uniref:Uncharacterized protein n=1 Tax=Punica granatum TaxID=22663 RepID=A0A2I0IQR7_PUNGR|nr:hypothetical protein CRG98_033247 [Punica granatum]
MPLGRGIMFDCFRRVLVDPLAASQMNQIPAYSNSSSSQTSFQLAVRRLISSNSIPQSLTLSFHTLFLSLVSLLPAIRSKIFSLPLSHSLWASHKCKVPFSQLVQLLPRSSPFIMSSMHLSRQATVQGRRFAPLSGPGLDMPPQAPRSGLAETHTASPTRCRRVFELSSCFPAASSCEIKDSRDRATIEVFMSPMPSRSFRPPKLEPDGTRYIPGTKNSGPSGAVQYPSTRFRTI